MATGIHLYFQTVYTVMGYTPQVLRNLGVNIFGAPLISPPILDFAFPNFCHNWKPKVAALLQNLADLTLTGGPREPIKFFEFLDGGRL